MKKIIIMIICSIFILVSIYMFMIISYHTVSKNYIASKNLQAKQTSEYIQSSECLFNEYYEKNNILKSGTNYFFGETTDYFDYIIYANEYCNQDEYLSPKPSSQKSIRYYWTIKITDGKISEVWVYESPLNQNQLKSYTYEQQIELIPKFSDEKYKYAIGYYKVDTNSQEKN